MWLTWDLPLMPWDGTTLWRADLDADGKPGAPIAVAGGPRESIFQPSWSPDGLLHVVSDRADGWWNLFHADFRGPLGELPPLVVPGHGGPTAQTSSAFSLTTQFWTRRGMAVLDVIYRGSTGYGV